MATAATGNQVSTRRETNRRFDRHLPAVWAGRIVNGRFVPFVDLFNITSVLTHMGYCTIWMCTCCNIFMR
jgi:hypothetical protein